MAPFFPAAKPPSFVELPALKEGDGVSIVASSAQLAAAFPHVYELGLERMRQLFKLRPIELPTTRACGSSLEERARDLMAAFRDPGSKAVISVIGGEEQILLLPFLDAKVFSENPKPFFGYSDNTNFCLYLWSLGIPSYYGGCIFTEYGMSGEIHAFTRQYLRTALFERRQTLIAPAAQFSDQDLDWSGAANLGCSYEYEENEGWLWDGTDSAQGILWGGCLEVLGLQLQVSKWLPAPEAVRGAILCLETSELVPDAWHVFAAMVGLGERGYLSGLAGLLVGRPKARSLSKGEPAPAQRKKYRDEQRQVILTQFRRYNKAAPVVMNMDFGHTRPQIPIPLGKTARINPSGREVHFCF